MIFQASPAAFQGVKLHPIGALKTMPTPIEIPPTTSRSSRRFALRAVVATVFVAAILFAGCVRDTNLRKQKFVAQGDIYFKAGKFPEAQISYSRALQIDPRYTVALYKSAQCNERLGNWNAAFQDLLRTVDLEPDNWPAQIDLGKIFLGAGKAQEAKEHALLVLHSNPKNVEAQILLSGADSALGNQKDALSEARDAVTLEPNRASAYLN